MHWVPQPMQLVLPGGLMLRERPLQGKTAKRALSSGQAELIVSSLLRAPQKRQAQ